MGGKKTFIYSQLFQIISPYKEAVSAHFLWKAQQCQAYTWLCLHRRKKNRFRRMPCADGCSVWWCWTSPTCGEGRGGFLGWPAVTQWPKQPHTFVTLMAIDSGIQYFLSRHLSVSSSLKSALGNLKPTSNWTNSERWDRICSVFLSALLLLISSSIWCLCRGLTPQFLKGEAN